MNAFLPSSRSRAAGHTLVIVLGLVTVSFLVLAASLDWCLTSTRLTDRSNLYLNTAAAADAYLLADRGTWLSFRNKADLAIVVQGDKRLFNQYGVILVDPAKHPTVKKEAGQRFIDWLISPQGQRAIADYKVGGEQLFFPNAGDPNA